MENSAKILVGVLAAVAAGVAIGMLIAPDSGSETRRKIGETAGNWASKVGDLVSAGKDKLSEVASNVTKQADGLINDAMKRGEQVKQPVA